MNSKAANAGMAQPAGEAPSGGVWLRIASGLALAPVALGAVWAGPPYFETLVAVAAVIMVWEWSEMFGHSKFAPMNILLTVSVLAVLGLVAFALYLPAFAAMFVGTVLIALLGKPGERGWACSGFFYIGLPSVGLIWLRHDPSVGFELILGLFVIVWTTDIGAYFAGRSIGGPKLAPKISPNKTWAGFIGGLLCAVIGTIAVVNVLAIEAVEIGAAILLAAGLSLASQLGDLLESWIKRRQAVKDTGALIPGHGGVLDRVDGLLLAAPLSAVLMLIYQRWWV